MSHTSTHKWTKDATSQSKPNNLVQKINIDTKQKKRYFEIAIYILHKKGRIDMNKVKKYRKEKGLSQMELASKADVTRQTITLIENNKYNPSLALCLKIAKALDSDLNTLFWEE